MIIKGEYIKKYNCNTHGHLIIKNSNRYSCLITTVQDEMNGLQETPNRISSSIDLRKRTNILRSIYQIVYNKDFIILKYENDNLIVNGNEISILHKIFLPVNNIKLNLTLFSETKMDIYISIGIDKKTEELYDSLKKKGYNIFDKNDKFYLEFCTPYVSPYGTDTILPDRMNDIMKKIN